MVSADSFREKLLVARLQHKDREAFGMLYDAYAVKIYRFIYFKVATKELAEDLTAQTFLKIWQYALQGNIKITESFQGLLYRSARNLVIDYYRTAAKLDQQTVSLDAASAIAAAAPEFESEADGQRNILERVRELKNEYQEVIILHYVNGLSIKEIAKVVEKRRGTVRVTLHRALKALRGKVRITSKS